MTLNTNFNTSPYFDDYDEAKEFYRILFKPAVAVQARELTQLQTIINNQIKRFGDGVIQEGSIVSGGNFVEVNPLPYVKILDGATDTNGDTVIITMSDYVGMKAVGQSSGIEAIVVAVSTGLESQAPNMNTLHVKYINNALDGSNENVSVFSDNEEIRLQTLNANNVYEDYQTVTVGGSIDASPVGNGYGVRCGDGILYQKGFFTSFNDDIVVVSKYSTKPDGVVVGFVTTESIVDSDEDTSLLDNASGFNNENAPGADRLKLESELVVKTLSEAESDEKFFAIQEYDNGAPIRRNTVSYSGIQDMIEKRTSEESGDYSVVSYGLRVEEDTSNTDYNSFIVGSGISYVEGKRVEILNDYSIPLEKATTYKTSDPQTITANYGHYLIANSISGDFGFDSFSTVDLKDGATTIGSARIRNLTNDVDGKYRLYVFDLNMNANAVFSDVDTIEDSTNGGSATIELVSGKPEIKDYSFVTPIYSLGKSFIKSVDTSSTTYTFRQADRSLSSDSSGEIVLTLSSGTLPYATGALNSDQIRDIIVVADQTVSPNSSGDILAIDSVTVNSSTQMTIQLDASDVPSSTMDVIVYYNAQKASFSPNTKSFKEVYIKIDTDTHGANTTGTYSLGMPDAHSISGVWIGNTYSESETDVTSQFNLIKNQKDTHYGLSYIKKKKGLTISSGDKILVKAKVFQQTSGNTFFCFDSYSSVIDDSSETLPSNKLRTEDIPTYTTSSGRKYYLRDVLDFRPHASNTATYSTTIGSATENPSNTATFSSSSINFPDANEEITLEYDYYEERCDILVIDVNGRFKIIQGNSGEYTPPVAPERGMVVAEIKIPPYPSLPSSVANRAGKKDYGISISRKSNKGYTMKDIGKIEKKIEDLTYYVSLNALEQKSKDLIIKDSNGLNRFKNGIFVDNFEDLSSSDVVSDEYSVSIDTTLKEITPKIRAIPLDLKVFSANNVTDYGKAATLIGDDISVINQPYATSSRSCTTDFYKYMGSVILDPAYDSATDTTIAPEINFDIDLATPFTEYTESLNEILSTQSVSTDVVTRGNTTTTTTSVSSLLVNDTVTTENVGDFVRDVQFSPYLRSREVKVQINGLRPNTRFYFFFDGVDVNAHMAKAEYSNGQIIKTSTFSNSNVITTDSSGNLYAIFRIPAETFLVGDRIFEAHDVSDYSGISSASSSAYTRYSGFNFSVEKSSATVSTRMPEVSVNTDITSVTQEVEVLSVLDIGGPDPISQTFIVEKSQSNDTIVQLSKVDLFFNSKSTTGKGVTVEIREVSNGYPSNKILPFSKVHLDVSDVNANNTVATNSTVVTFDAPVSIKTGVEYALVVRPDGNDPDYRVWISRVGENDVDTGISIKQDTNSGVLFTSTNNKTWTPYQNENLKFKLYRKDYSTSSGSLVLTNNDHEFLRVSGTSGTFFGGEYVFVSSSNLTGTVAISSGNNTIVGSSTTFESDFEVGEHIVVEHANTEYQVMEISAIANNTTMTVSDIPFVSNTSSNYFGSVVGRMAAHITNDPEMIVLEDSSAKSGKVFEANNVIIGAESGATTTISEVHDQEISYYQNSIYRTNSTNTKTDISLDAVWDESSTYSGTSTFNNNNYLTLKPSFVMSKSNEITEGAGSTFRLNVSLENTSANNHVTSPFVDYSISNVTIYENVINNDVTDENTNEGDATSKYISKPVELDDGLEAEDMKIYLTAYRPQDSEINVYVRYQSAYDPREFDEIPWSLMTVKSETNSYSSLANRYDYREYEYGLVSTAQTAENGAYIVNDVIEYLDDVGAKHQNFKKFAVKIVLTSSGHHRIPRLKDMRAIALS